jgi:hypothetical protein
MSIHIYLALLSMPLLMQIGAWQKAMAQSSSVPAIAPRSGLTPEQVVNNLVQRNLTRAQGLAAYQGTRTYRLEYQGFAGSRSAEMLVDVRYKSPGTKSEKEALSDENVSRTALNRDNYKFAQVGYETTPTGALYVLSVEPRTKNKFLYRGRIWVDAQDFAVVRLQGEPVKNPSFWTKDTKIEATYVKVSDFWCPASNRSSSSIRLGGRAYLTIDYKDYRATPRQYDSNITTAGYQ